MDLKGREHIRSAQTMMSTKTFLLLALLLLIQIGSCKADAIGVYWGLSDDNGNLTETCATGKYTYVVIYYLNTSRAEFSPQLVDSSGRCNPPSSGCTTIGTSIKYCQEQGIKVMLYIAGDGWNVTLSSSKNAQNVSDYLWSNFMGGSSYSRPFGDAILDGINFDIRYSTPYWKDLAHYLKSHSTAPRKVYLSASPLCRFPDNFRGAALEENGLFDYVFIQFQNDPACEYSDANADNLLTTWDQWSKSLNGSKVFLYLPASQYDGNAGYIPRDDLISKVLPIERKSPSYGGVMLWTRGFDKKSSYSNYIQLNSPCTLQSAPKCRNHDRGFVERVGYMSNDSFKIYETENLGAQYCENLCKNNCLCVAYVTLNEDMNDGCQTWVEGARFIEDAGAKGRSIYVVRPKGRSNFLTRTRPTSWNILFIL